MAIRPSGPSRYLSRAARTLRFGHDAGSTRWSGSSPSDRKLAHLGRGVKPSTSRSRTTLSPPAFVRGTLSIAPVRSTSCVAPRSQPVPRAGRPSVADRRGQWAGPARRHRGRRKAIRSFDGRPIPRRRRSSDANGTLRSSRWRAFAVFWCRMWGRDPRRANEERPSKRSIPSARRTRPPEPPLGHRRGGDERHRQPHQGGVGKRSISSTNAASSRARRAATNAAPQATGRWGRAAASTARPCWHAILSEIGGGRMCYVPPGSGHPQRPGPRPACRNSGGAHATTCPSLSRSSNPEGRHRQPPPRSGPVRCRLVAERDRDRRSRGISSRHVVTVANIADAISARPATSRQLVDAGRSRLRPARPRSTPAARCGPIRAQRPPPTAARRRTQRRRRGRRHPGSARSRAR